MHRRGFTLIELLVVIAIIAILAAILFPVFAKAREKARQSSCLSNMKQITLAFLQYAQDFDETYPSGRPQYYACANDSVAFWFHCITPYIKNTQIFKCPSSSSGGNPQCAKFFPWARAMNVINNYGVNCNFGTSGGIKMADVRQPASLIYLSDICNGGPGWSRLFIDPANLGCPAYSEAHNGGNNTTYADGHAKWLQGTKGFAPSKAVYNGNLPWAVGSDTMASGY
jgi:prepilin-type N-terminal cleavage/methylation domain-containing protein/prepilin-type processing-associated H-X9-DG protein